jgi:hypothetical protein
MKPGKLTYTAIAIIISSAALFMHAPRAQTPVTGMKPKKGDRLQDDSFSTLGAMATSIFQPKRESAKPAQRYPWKNDIVTTVFWVGEEPTSRNPVPNRSSSWDKNWSASYGGFDNPDRGARAGYIPAAFTPKQNPFYCALPYNDKAHEGHRAEAPQVVPWFKEAYQGPAISTCKGRWVAIRKGKRVAYAQWEDAGPFRTDHWQYVFGSERPKPNLNKGAGLDVSPAVRDFLGLNDTDVTDWRFVDFNEVPHGPWAQYGDNNNFVLNERRSQTAQAQRSPDDSSR